MWSRLATVFLLCLRKKEQNANLPQGGQHSLSVAGGRWKPCVRKKKTFLED